MSKEVSRQDACAPRDNSMLERSSDALAILCGSLCDLCGECFSKQFHHRGTENHRELTEKLKDSS